MVLVSAALMWVECIGTIRSSKVSIMLFFYKLKNMVHIRVE